MITKTDDEVIAYILDECAKKDSPRSVYNLIMEYTKYTREDNYATLSALHKRVLDIIESKSLASFGADRGKISANTNTFDIKKEGGYIAYIARLREKERLQREADEARNWTAIIQWRTIKWSFGISIAAILIAFASLIVSFCR